MFSGRTRTARLRGFVLAAMSAALAGCVDRAGDLVAATPGESRAGRVIASPAGATIAFVSVEGAPPEIAARFAQMTAAEAARREVSVADRDRAHYLVRGYLSAYPADGGTALAYVWDVFDRSRRRIQRGEDAVVVRGAAANPWHAADNAALGSLAARAADDLAAILSQTPEAVAGRATPAAGAIAATVVTPAGGLPAAASAFR